MHFAVGGVLLLLYLLTLCPTVYVGDSGELVTAAFELGVAHPPGYPLYVLLARLATLLPFGEIAFRVNLLSALASAASGVVLTMILTGARFGGSGRTGGRGGSLLSPRSIAAGALVLTLFVSSLVWLESVKAEVYTLHALLIALVLYAADRRRYVLSLFLIGLGAANHQTIVLLAPGVLYLMHARGDLNASRVVRGVLFALVALSLYFVMLVRPGDDVFAWRKPHDLSGLVEHVLRTQYGELSTLPRSGSLVLQQAVYFVVLLVKSFPPALLLPWALVSAWRKAERARSLVIHFAFTGPVLLVLLNHGTGALDGAVASVYYIPAAILALLTTGPFVLDLLKSRPPALSYAALALPACLVALGWNTCNARGVTLAREVAAATLAAVPQDGYLLTEGDNNTFPLFYAQRVLGARPDVTIVDRDLNFFGSALGIPVDSPMRFDERDRALSGLLLRPDTQVASVNKFTEEMEGLPLLSAGPVYRFVPAPELIAPARAAFYHESGRPSQPSGDYFVRRLAINYASRWLDHYALTEDVSALREESNRLAAWAGNVREAMLVLGRSRAASGDTTAAIRTLREGVLHDPGYGQGRRELGGLLYARRDFLGAAEQYRFVAESEGLAGDWLNLANALRLSGRRDEAIDAYSRVEKAPGADLEILTGLARGYGALQLDSEGVRLLEEVRRRSASFSAYEELADGYDRLGDPARALETYRVARTNEPRNADIAYKGGVAALRTGDYVYAESELRRSLTLESEGYGAMNALAYLLYQKGENLGDALQWVDLAIDMADSTVVGYYYDTRGAILRKMGRRAQAEAAFRVAIERTPENDTAARAESHANLAEVCEATGRVEEARRLRAQADSLRNLP
ncbi:MAG: DUF2723 domain-containing protein [Gemmatimonadetes bacterium]|nr:DUF2723 domain-containing protein [Gemmatimonadota bacterium]